MSREVYVLSLFPLCLSLMRVTPRNLEASSWCCSALVPVHDFTSCRIEPLTKKQESPYQFSLDIPVQPHQNTDPSILESSGAPDGPTPDHLDNGNDASAHDSLPESIGAGSIHATQISLLDELSRTEAESLSQRLKVGSNSFSQASTPKGSTIVPELSPSNVAIAIPSDSPIAEPYLLPVGSIIASPGGHFSYRILGACCRLFDRDELPWPCCRIQWRSKEPSWKRIGKRFVPDLATKRFPSYMVEILDHEYSREPFVLTLYWLKFPSNVQDWWYTRYVPSSKSKAQP